MVVNPPHDKLPWLVLVSCICGRLNGNWVRQQWDDIQYVWDIECKEVVGPIIGHAFDRNSCRR